MTETCSACGRPVTEDAGFCSGPHTNADGISGDPWWEARVLAHVQAPTREAADDVISSLFDRDEVMGGHWRCDLIEEEDR